MGEGCTLSPRLRALLPPRNGGSVCSVAALYPSRSLAGAPPGRLRLRRLGWRAGDSAMARAPPPSKLLVCFDSSPPAEERGQVLGLLSADRQVARIG
eukprot:14568599-Alexandrium_andersonii.AAC.1